MFTGTSSIVVIEAIAKSVYSHATVEKKRPTHEFPELF